MDTLSESDDSLLLNISSGDGTIRLSKLDFLDGKGLWPCWRRNTQHDRGTFFLDSKGYFTCIVQILHLVQIRSS